MCRLARFGPAGVEVPAEQIMRAGQVEWRYKTRISLGVLPCSPCSPSRSRTIYAAQANRSFEIPSESESIMNGHIICEKAHMHTAKLAAKQEEAIIVTICKIVTTGPAVELQTSAPSSQDLRPRRRLTKRYLLHQIFPPTPPTAIHPALRPISVFSSASSSADSASTMGLGYDRMSTGSRPSTSWTVGRDYNSMRPGKLPNSDRTTGLSYDEMRA